MTTQQSAASKLADQLDAAQPDDLLETDLVPKAADELRRLHAASLDCIEYVNAIKAERDELLEALKLAEKHCPVDSHAEILARAAIARATGEAV